MNCCFLYACDAFSTLMIAKAAKPTAAKPTRLVG